jgi:hypothetical protein
MRLATKLFAVTAVIGALVIVPVALAATATHTPARPKVGQIVKITVKGMKGGERVKAVESLPFGQQRTLYPRLRTSASGVIIISVKAQIKGKHSWTIKGRQSKRVAKTSYYVR